MTSRVMKGVAAMLRVIIEVVIIVLLTGDHLDDRSPQLDSDL